MKAIKTDSMTHLLPGGADDWVMIPRSGLNLIENMIELEERALVRQEVYKELSAQELLRRRIAIDAKRQMLAGVKEIIRAALEAGGPDVETMEIVQGGQKVWEEVRAVRTDEKRA